MAEESTYKLSGGESTRIDDLGLFDRAGIQTTEEGLELLGNVLESATEYSVIATDCDGVIVLWNEGARRLYGYAAGGGARPIHR